MYDYKYLLDQFPNCYTFLFIISGSSWKISMLHIIIPVIPGGFFRKNIKYKCLTKIVLVLRKVAECGQLRSKVKTLLHERFFTWYMCIPFILSGSPKNLKKKLATRVSSTRNYNLENRIAGSSLRPQLRDGCRNSLLAWFICLLKMEWPAPAVQKNDCGTKSEGGKNFSAHISMRRPHDLNAWKTLTFALFRL